MGRTVSASDSDVVQVASTFAPLVTRSDIGQRRDKGKDCAEAAAVALSERRRHWLRERELRVLAESGRADRVFIPGFLSDKPQRRRSRDDSDRASWIALAILTVLGIAFFIFALFNPELIANIFGSN